MIFELIDDSGVRARKRRSSAIRRDIERRRRRWRKLEEMSIFSNLVKAERNEEAAIYQLNEEAKST